MTSDELNWRFLHAPKAFLYLSVAFHLCIPLFFGTVMVLDKLGWSLLGPRRQTKEVYQEFIQVDVVGLPDQLLGQMDNVDTSLPQSEKPIPPAKVEEAAAPPETKGEEKGKTEEDIMASLEAKRVAEAAKVKAEQEKKEKEREAKEREQALKQIEADAKREAALKELADSGSRGKLKGNLLSKGTSAKGLIGTAKDRYISLIAKKVKDNFNIFSWQKKRGLVGVVFLKVNAQGKLKERRIVRASKDPIFDSALLQAVDESAPYPIPDDDSVLREGITIEFRPDE
jgi:colicin import membrane protein